MKKRSFILSLIILSLSLISCQEKKQKKEEEKIWIVAQPQIELNRSVVVKIFFKNKPDSGSVRVQQFSNEGNHELNGAQIEEGMEHDGTNYHYDMLFEAGKLGKSDFPIISADIDGVNYKSAPVSIEVVKKQQVDSNSVRLSLIADKDRYHLKDTIRVSLLEYSRFSGKARFTPADLVKNGAPEALFAVIAEGNVDYKVGIVGFKAFIDSNFNVINFDWNANEVGERMVKLNKEDLIEQRIFDIKMIARKEGKFTMPPSRFDYKVYPYKEAFKEDLLAPKGTLETKNKIKVRSDALHIIVEK